MVMTSNQELASPALEWAKSARITGPWLFYSLLLKACMIKTASSKAIFPFIYACLRLLSLFEIDIVEAIFREKTAY